MKNYRAFCYCVFSYLLGLPPHVAAQDPFYKGKAIRIIVGEFGRLMLVTPGTPSARIKMENAKLVSHTV